MTPARIAERHAFPAACARVNAAYLRRVARLRIALPKASKERWTVETTRERRAA